MPFFVFSLLYSFSSTLSFQCIPRLVFCPQVSCNCPGRFRFFPSLWPSQCSSDFRIFVSSCLVEKECSVTSFFFLSTSECLFLSFLFVFFNYMSMHFFLFLFCVIFRSVSVSSFFPPPFSNAI